MNDSFAKLVDVIKHRRSTKPAHMNGKVIPDEQIEQLIELADWAPTHGNTEPWRFVVYGGEGVKIFSKDHAELYKLATSPEKYLQANYDKILHNGDTVSHIIIAIMRRGNLPKIPPIEELSAVSTSIQNILLGATSLGIATLWSTGGMVHHQVMKNYFKLREEDVIVGQIFLGYADAETKGRRVVPIEEKVKWVK
ncbi:nitroreductase family protein [Ferruginibacter sp. SUN002]|uniref:nitroreductase family protein n=1 Tax=Ferruginibacter sp. SUN002 TaxID=2937789 RepID=UPI003D35EA12